MAQKASLNNQQIALPVNSYFLPKSSDGHYLSSEDGIIKKTPLLGARITANKIANDIFVYTKKGLKGSKNSNFYEFLSLGLIPNIIGSATLIALFTGANKLFNTQDKLFANLKGSQMAAGVLLYATGKWLGGKLINKGVQAYTGIDMDMAYRKVVRELPDFPGDKKTTSIEFHRVFESVDFPRWDLINKMGEEKGNRYEFYDHKAKKMGYKEKLSSPDQTVQPKIKKVVTKAMGAKAISSFLWAALGVSLAAQKPFADIFKTGYKKLSVYEKIKAFPVKLAKALKESSVDLYKGVISRDAATNTVKTSKLGGILGKGLIFAAAGTTILGILNANRGYRVKNKNQKPNINFKKEYTEA